MRVLKALDLGKTPAWVTVTPLADWGLELYCKTCGETSSIHQRNLVKQQETVRRWFDRHARCATHGKGNGG